VLEQYNIFLDALVSPSSLLPKPSKKTIDRTMTQVSFEALITGVNAGNLISFPTDTVPALAARPDRAESVYAAKQRSYEKPLVLMGATFNSLLPYVRGTEQEFQIWQAIAEKYLPGQLTLVLPASASVPPQMNPQNPTTIGLRVPDCQVAVDLLSATGPLATTSINRSGEPPLTSLEEIMQAFPQVLVPPTPLWKQAQGASKQPSTVVVWRQGSWEVLRQGAIAFAP